MKNTIKLFILFLFVIPSILQSQNNDWREYIMMQSEEEQLNADAIENMYEELHYLENNPFNLNTVTVDQLESFPLLSSSEITSIIKFLEENKPIVTVYELRNVPYLNFNKLQLIIPFFKVGEAKVDNNIASVLHEVQFRLDKTLTPRSGYGEFSDSILERYPNRKYQGENFYNSIRYSMHIKDKIEAGVTAEKDAGEPFLKDSYPKGYDHYGVHFIMRNRKQLSTLALGDYRLSFGQGLILSNGFAGSKAWGLDNIARKTISPKRHFSTAESNFFRGGAAVYEIGDFSVTAFYSNKRIDANISEEGHITSFKNDGLHRTKSEIEKKKNSREQAYGANINYRKNRFQAGVSGIHYEYNRMYNPTRQDYNRYYLRDNSNFNASIDYSYQLPGFIFAGETAISKNKAIATLNSVQYRPSTNLSLSILYRDYPISYNALFAQAFSEGSRVQNEKGLYFGVIIKPYYKILINSYLDFARFPWKKYGVNDKSKTIDYYLRSSYNLSQISTLEARYKYKRKEKNQTNPEDNIKYVLPYSTHKLRFRYNYENRNGLYLRSTVDLARYNEVYKEKEEGIMISQNIGYKSMRKLTGDAFIAWFSTDSYNSRLYSYERNLLSTFYMPSFYGKGVRFALSAKHAITTSLSLSVKAGHTKYFNRDVIGSGTEQINGNSRTDIYTYLRLRF